MISLIFIMMAQESKTPMEANSAHVLVTMIFAYGPAKTSPVAGLTWLITIKSIRNKTTNLVKDLTETLHNILESKNGKFLRYNFETIMMYVTSKYLFADLK